MKMSIDVDLAPNTNEVETPLMVKLPGKGKD